MNAVGKYMYCIIAAILVLQFASLIGFDAISLDDIFDTALGVLCILKLAEDSRKSSKPSSPKRSDSLRRSFSDNMQNESLRRSFSRSTTTGTDRYRIYI